MWSNNVLPSPSDGGSAHAEIWQDAPEHRRGGYCGWHAIYPQSITLFTLIPLNYMDAPLGWMPLTRTSHERRQIHCRNDYRNTYLDAEPVFFQDHARPRIPLRRRAVCPAGCAHR